MKTALVLAGYNRPQYFTRCVTSLATNPEAAELPLYLFQDGGPDSCFAQYRQAVFAAGLNHCQFSVRAENWGLGRHLIDIRRQIFDELGYDRMILVEDDVVVAPQYLRLLINLADWAEANFSEVGSVSCFRRNQYTLEEKRAKRNIVVAENTNWISYMMFKSCWDAIRPILEEYENTCLAGQDYRKRPHGEIEQFFERLLGEALPRRGTKLVPPSTYHGWADSVDRFRVKQTADGQDACTMLAHYVAGLVKITTLVNRCIHIGEYGVHARPHMAGIIGLSCMTVDEFPDDRELTEFQCI